MPERRLPAHADASILRAEISRLHKIIGALMDRAERSTSIQDSDFNLFQSEVMLEEQVDLRTAELEKTLREKDQATHALQESEERFQSLVEQSLVGISMTDGKRFIYANPKFAEITGYDVDELHALGPIDIAPESDRDHVAEILHKRLSGELGRISFNSKVLRKDGKAIIVEISSGPPVTVDGRPVLISVFIDITEKVRAENTIKALNDQLREQAIRDPLTGLYNRRYMEESLERELIQAARHDKTVGIVMGDLDLFKIVNDTHGHQAGDQVLRVFGALFKRHARGSDICCRYGGEEFLLVLPGMDLDGARKRAELLRTELASTVIPFNDQSLQVSISFGVAAFPEQGENVDALIASADRALYQAKTSGRNRVHCA